MSYPISEIREIGPVMAERLRSQRIRTTAKLLLRTKNLRGRQELAAKIGVPETTLLKWANLSDRMRIKGVGEDYAHLLAAAGVDTVRELKYRNPKNLAQAMAKQNEKRKLVQLLPSEKAVAKWVEYARNLPLMISY
jgi:predicted flap endonuclease-1-like 5' DNA nuclease